MTQSRLALFGERFIQAGWLAALIVAPLYFNIYSSRVFEPDKITLIRTLAIAMGAAWLLVRAERWQPAQVRLARDLRGRLTDWLKQASEGNPLTLPALVLLVAFLISTLLSVSPTVSFFGSYQRLQGLYTFSSYLVIFFLAASLLRTRADMERAISLALVVSFPIAFYGIIQHYFLDPLPWVGDVTTRVASTLGNSIFIGSFLILTIPLALARLLQTGDRATRQLPTARGRLLFTVAAVMTVVAIAGAWGLSFDLGAKNLIEANYTGTLTPEQLRAAANAFTVALSISILVVLLWWGAALLLKQRASNFLLMALYSALLAIQLLALLFSQSRGPLLGFLGGMFTFGVLYALVRGARKLAVGAVGAAVLVLVLLALINIPQSPLAALRELPYVGRLGRVFETEGGTGRVRILIWEGALQLVLPHTPLWSPTTGEDAFNVIRPLVGYGPETMYVAYNRFYPPELGQLESRNATPDRSHNETFDALVTTGLFGFVAENILFLLVFYFALRWLGLIPSPRARNIFIALWFGAGILSALAFGAILGWQFIGVALPGGMILGLFLYLVAFGLTAKPSQALAPPEALWLVALTSLFVAHFIEIHFGIAIVSSRVYFWFFAALLVALGTRRLTLETPESSAPQPSPALAAARPVQGATDRARRDKPRAVGAATAAKKESRRPAPARDRVSTTSLITFAFLVGFVLAVMGFDYISTNNLGALGDRTASGLDIVITALTIKNTTGGGMTSLAMLALMLTTLLVGMGVGLSEWGNPFRISVRDWASVTLLFVVLALAIFSGLVFYHVLLIASPPSAILDALLNSTILFTLYLLIVVSVCAITLLFDEPLPALWVRRTTNWVVLPVMIILAAVLIMATNIDPIRADMLYKQAAGLTGQDNAQSIDLFQRALALQPQQDYYLLFLGRTYLDAAKTATDATEREQDLQRADTALKRAREINPYNTDHSANLARLAQARGSLESNPSAQIEAYKQASDYFGQATRLSPNTAHLYDQHAQALLEYAALLQSQNDTQGAAAVHAQARDQVEHAMQVDSTFCFTYAVRAEAQASWRDRTTDALDAIQRAPNCGDVFTAEGLAVAVDALARASQEAVQANQGDAFEAMLKAAAQVKPTLEVYTTLANYYSKAGRIPEALAALDQAVAQIPASETDTLKRYQDFRFTLVNLQKALDAVRAAPNDPEAQRALAEQWLARGQSDRALPAFEKVLQLKPDDYAAQRKIVLLLIATDQLAQAQQRLAHVQAIAPAGDQVFWQRLGGVLSGIADGNHDQAVSQLDELARSADKQDYALTGALHALAAKLKIAG